MFALYVRDKDIDNLEVLYNKYLDCRSGQRYSIIVRLSYLNSDFSGGLATDWKYLGIQIYLEFEDLNSLYSRIKDIHSIISVRLDQNLALYGIKSQEV